MKRWKECIYTSVLHSRPYMNLQEGYIRMDECLSFPCKLHCVRCVFHLKFSFHRNARVPSPDFIRLYFNSLSSQHPGATEITNILHHSLDPSKKLQSSLQKTKRMRGAKRSAPDDPSEEQMWADRTDMQCSSQKAGRESSAVCVCVCVV